MQYMKMMPVNAREFARVCEGMSREHISLLFSDSRDGCLRGKFSTRVVKMIN